MVRPRAVIFDIGNVLLEWRPERYYDARIGPAARQALFAEAGLEAMNLSIDEGAPFRDTVEATAARFPHWAEPIRWWHDRWLDLAGPPIAGSVALLRELKAAGVPVFALTNFGAETFALARTRLAFLNEFDRAYVSGDLRLLKPDPRIYAAVEADCGLPPPALLFTDDRPENVAAAAARGWQVHLFDGPPGLAQRLAAAGLPVAAAVTP
jgi:2-haloacid dehalogenase